MVSPVAGCGDCISFCWFAKPRPVALEPPLLLRNTDSNSTGEKTQSIDSQSLSEESFHFDSSQGHLFCSIFLGRATKGEGCRVCGRTKMDTYVGVETSVDGVVLLEVAGLLSFREASCSSV